MWSAFRYFPHTLAHCQFYDDDRRMFQLHDPPRDIAAHFTRSAFVKTGALAKLTFFISYNFIPRHRLHLLLLLLFVCLFVFLALKPIVVVFSQPGSGI
jgi:Ca2+/Na+ antiporter